MHSSSREGSEDTEADAVPENRQAEAQASNATRSSERALGARPKAARSSQSHLNVHASSQDTRLSSINNSQTLVQSAKPFSPYDDSEYKQYLFHMPPKLQQDNIDILIICANEDMKDAAIFQNHLSKDILFYIGDIRWVPRVKLLQEVYDLSTDNLDLAFKKALYTFLYVTKAFCTDTWTLLKGHACLTEAIYDEHKKWSVVPVHTAPKKKQGYKLPMMLNSLRPINYWKDGQDQFYIEGVRKLLEMKSAVLLENERKLHEKRLKYFNDERSNILENVQYAKKHLTKSSSSESHQSQTSNSGSASLKLPRNVPQMSSRHTSDSSSNHPIVEESVASDKTHVLGIVSNTLTYSSIPDNHNDKAVPEENVAAIAGGLEEEPEISQGMAASNSNSLNVNIRVAPHRAHDITQNQESLRGHSSPTDLIGQQRTLRDHCRVVQQSTSAIPPHLTAGRVDSFLVADGPVNDDPSPSLRQQNAVSSGFQFRNSTYPNIASSAHHVPAGSSSVETLNGHIGMPASSLRVPASSLGIQMPTGYVYPGYGTCIPNTFSRPVYPQMLLHQLLYNPYYGSDSNLYHSVQSQQYPSVPPHNMQDLYSFANPFPQGYFQTPPPQYEEVASCGSGIEDSRTSTEANASASFQPSLHHSSSMGTLNFPGSLPGMYQQQHMPTFHPNIFQTQMFPHMTSQFPVSAPQPTTASFHQQHRQQLHTSASHEHVPSLGRDQPGTRGTVPSAEAQSSTGSARVPPSSAGSTATSVVKHIHHHHHQKTVNVKRAMNVLVGDKSKFLNRKQSLDMVSGDDDDDDDDDDDEEEDKTTGESRSPHPTSQDMQSSGTNISTPGGADSSASGVLRHVNPVAGQAEEVLVGFAELMSRVSNTESVESLEPGNTYDDKSQTYCKRVI